MYVPKSFQVDDREQLFAFMQRHSFATLVTLEHRDHRAAPFATHLPLLARDGRLFGHMAKANPQWRQLAEAAECLAIFHGPHACVSPTWYATQPAVPTWNYAAVHVYGKARLIESSARLTELLAEMIAFYEAGQEQPWDGALSSEVRDPLLAAIVGFEIEITRLEGKFKFNQNRSREDQDRVIEHLSKSTHAEDQAAAALMRDLELG
jgi:transcriptional regulator